SNDAYPHIESRIRDAIDNWGARYFKFDFMVWLDCAGQNDLYQQHDAFVAMLDRLRRDHPNVVLQTDETNDYRLFPFESTLRGPLDQLLQGPPRLVLARDVCPARRPARERLGGAPGVGPRRAARSPAGVQAGRRGRYAPDRATRRQAGPSLPPDRRAERPGR